MVFTNMGGGRLKITDQIHTCRLLLRGFSGVIKHFKTIFSFFGCYTPVRYGGGLTPPVPPYSVYDYWSLGIGTIIDLFRYLNVLIYIYVS